jgi:hypothetical protein
MLSRSGCLGVLLSLALAGVTMGQDAEELQPQVEEFQPFTMDTVDPSPEADNDRLFGLFLPTATNFNDFISPMSNPVFFEDPRNLTEARMIFFNHNFPEGLGGQNMQVYQLQLRAAVTENLSVIMNKAGFVVSQNPLVDDGFSDLSFGFKYNFFKDPDSQTLISTGLTYAIPVGSSQTLQGRADGEFNMFGSLGTEFFPDCRYVTTTGARLPGNHNTGNQLWYWSNHADIRLGKIGVYLFTECNWYHYLSGAHSYPPPIGGMDFFNLGTIGIGGQDTVTGAGGVKIKPAENMELGIAYEFPYTQRKDLQQNRLIVDFIIRY